MKRKKLEVHGYYIDSSGSWILLQDADGRIIKRKLK
jgi:hypothetical protein|tara:strand:- start:921 stop:1028 length:108 start_codon:yes stop_codon:yes gene_type:complete